jgi:type I restriction enzyme M protein
MLPKKYEPEIAIDICAGSGNFLNIAKSKWENIDLVGVDLNLGELQILNISNDLYKFDALNIPRLKKELAPHLSKKKILLANPPFGKVSSKNLLPINSTKLDQIYNEALKSRRIEALMLVSNISILNKGDYFGAVLPENFFTSLKLKFFKEVFISYFDEVIVGEPDKYFTQSEVKTRLFIGKFNKIRNVDIINDDDLHDEPSRSLKLLRGIDNSILINQDETDGINNLNEVLHFSNNEGRVLKRKYVKISDRYKRLIVSENDILILRVGRNSGKIFIPSQEHIEKYVSDYFYLLKDVKLNDYQIKLLNELFGKSINGLTSKYLAKKDIVISLNRVLN